MPWALSTGGVFALLAWVAPGLLAWPNRLWMKFGALLHRLTSPVALTAIYLIGIVPVGVLMRLLGKDPLRLQRAATGQTYWIPRTPPARADLRMKRQF